MSGLRLVWKAGARPPGLVDASVLRPDTLCRTTAIELYRTPIRIGGSEVALGDAFDVIFVAEKPEPYLAVEGSELFVGIGAGMCEGELRVEGHAGAMAGAAMRGGELHVLGDAGQLPGAGMEGGLLAIDGSAGDRVGGPLPGRILGMRGGEIVILGDCGDEAGLRLRRGLIAVRGTAGATPGASLVAGTVVVLSGDLDRPGIGMRRGSVIGLGSRIDPPASFRDDGPARPLFWRVLASRILDLLGPARGSSPERDIVEAGFRAFSGDWTELGKGEVLYRI